ncbi:MAG TPA: GFA family protein [Stellaceae bacterium]|nr:GFA family protein [Stellaceae bacterium]
MKVTGHCHCGNISFEAEIDPAQVRICHCTDCQTLSGSAFRVNVASLPGTFVLKSGAPKTYIKTTADSGNHRAHGFCPECGTPLWATSTDANPRSYGLRVGTLDCRTELTPSRQGWYRSALPWSQDLSGVPQVERQR